MNRRGSGHMNRMNWRGSGHMMYYRGTIGWFGFVMNYWWSISRFNGSWMYEWFNHWKRCLMVNCMVWHRRMGNVIVMVWHRCVGNIIIVMRHMWHIIVMMYYFIFMMRNGHMRNMVVDMYFMMNWWWSISWFWMMSKVMIFVMRIWRRGRSMVWETSHVMWHR